MYELQSTPIHGSEKKIIHNIENIEDVFKHVKQLFEEGYKVIKIKYIK